MAAVTSTTPTAKTVSLFEKMKSSISDLSSKVTEVSKKAFNTITNTLGNIALGAAMVIGGTVYVAAKVIDEAIAATAIGLFLAVSLFILISPIAVPVILAVLLFR